MLEVYSSFDLTSTLYAWALVLGELDLRYLIRKLRAFEACPVIEVMCFHQVKSLDKVTPSTYCLQLLFNTSE